MSVSIPQRLPLLSKHPINGTNRHSSHTQDGFVTFDVGSRYKLLENIGTGAYGVVCSAIDTKTKNHVAIKKIVNPFDIVTTAKRTLRELKLLLHFKHDNVVGIKNIVQSENKNLKDVYLVMDLMETDLHHIIRSEQVLTSEHICYFLYQLLRGIKYIHSANVIHRDLKPSNLLVNENCELKIGDFGMARGVSMRPEDPKLFMTEYVATRWYRAPELMLSAGSYSQSIDMWSVGCIFAEMLGRRQIFPGRNYVHQLQLVISVLGSPASNLINSIRSERVRRYMQNLPHKEPVPLVSLYPKASKEMIEILSMLLTFDPSNRPSADRILNHQFFRHYHDNEDEPMCHAPFDFRFEATVTKEEVFQQVSDIINQYHCRKTRLSKQLVVVSKQPQPAKTSTTNENMPKTQESVFKKPQTPVTGQKILPKPIDSIQKPPTLDVDMKSASSVCSMDLSLELGTQTGEGVTKLPHEKPPATESAKKPMITVQVVQDAEPDGEIVVEKEIPPPKETKATRSSEPSKRHTTSKSKSNNAEKKKTISEATKNKIRDAIFASMLSKQKGLGKPNEKTKKSVTAAERQREREEKRRKRQERAAEKEKKKREAEDADKKKELSEADRTLLERWTNMQKTDVPIPSKAKENKKPDTNSASNMTKDKSSTDKKLFRHKSLPSSASNPYRHLVTGNQTTTKRWSMNDDQTQTVGQPAKPDVFAVVMGNNPNPTPGGTLVLNSTVAGSNSMVMSSFSDITSSINALTLNIETNQPSQQNSKTTSKPGHNGFIPEPSYQPMVHSNRPVTIANQPSTSANNQFLNTNQGGVFIPETEAPVTSPENTRPTSLFTNLEQNNISVYVNNQVMTPGQASMQNCLTTPSGKNLVSLSPDTVDFVLDEELNDHHRVASDPLLMSAKSSSSLEGGVTLSPGGTSLVFRAKQPKVKSKPVSFPLAENPAMQSVVITCNPQTMMKDSLVSASQSLGKPMYAATTGASTYNRNPQPTNDSPLSNGGLFVPNIDNSISLNAHHYGPLTQSDALPTSAAAADATGSGYGLGINIDDLIPHTTGEGGIMSGMDFTATSGDSLDPCSSSLLRDWLDVHCLQPADMEALQKDLELGSPMSVDGDMKLD